MVTHFDELMLSWDMTFKDTKGTDCVVGQVWMRRGADAYLLDQVRDRMDFVAHAGRSSGSWPPGGRKRCSSSWRTRRTGRR